MIRGALTCFKWSVHRKSLETTALDGSAHSIGHLFFCQNLGQGNKPLHSLANKLFASNKVLKYRATLSPRSNNNQEKGNLWTFFWRKIGVSLSEEREWCGPIHFLAKSRYEKLDLKPSGKRKGKKNLTRKDFKIVKKQFIEASIVCKSINIFWFSSTSNQDNIDTKGIRLYRNVQNRYFYKLQITIESVFLTKIFSWLCQALVLVVFLWAIKFTYWGFFPSNSDSIWFHLEYPIYLVLVFSRTENESFF